jgi:putative endonuclease
MYTVYALLSEKRNYIYVGLTLDFRRRVNEHNSKRNKTTKPYAPFKVIYTEQQATRELARAREKYFKSGAGKEFLKSLN